VTKIADNSLAQYSQRLAQMRAHRCGSTLCAAAEDLLRQLENVGDVQLLALSTEGLGLAAAVAAMRDEPTAWAPLELARPLQLPTTTRLFIVEPIEVGPGVTRAVTALYPGVSFLVPEREDAALAAA
jgi:hypothetical protein